ncbi:MAG: altronate dehydratase, partial [Planctomycetota bacterium]
MAATLIHIHPQDNVAVATGPLAAGTTVSVGKIVVSLRQEVRLGDKVAIVPIAEGDAVLKYGLPIGKATTSIQPGEYVHTHNLASNYYPTFDHR